MCKEFLVILIFNSSNIRVSREENNNHSLIYKKQLAIIVFLKKSSNIYSFFYVKLTLHRVFAKFRVENFRRDNQTVNQF